MVNSRRSGLFDFQDVCTCAILPCQVERCTCAWHLEGLLKTSCCPFCRFKVDFINSRHVYFSLKYLKTPFTSNTCEWFLCWVKEVLFLEKRAQVPRTRHLHKYMWIVKYSVKEFFKFLEKSFLFFFSPLDILRYRKHISSQQYTRKKLVLKFKCVFLIHAHAQHSKSIQFPTRRTNRGMWVNGSKTNKLYERRPDIRQRKSVP